MRVATSLAGLALYSSLALWGGCSSSPSAGHDAGVDAGEASDAAPGPEAGQDDAGPPLAREDFVRIASGGIDERLNGYPWGMELFDGDGDGVPEVYVGTVANPLCLQAALGAQAGYDVDLPPPRWQCRNDLWGDWEAFLYASIAPAHVYRGTLDAASGEWTWSRVFSPAITETLGFRGARVFNGALYFLGMALSGGLVWKTTDGATFAKASPADLAPPGSTPVAGGLRGAVVFKDRLYVANNGVCEIYASAAPSTDWASWEKVTDTGFVASGGEVDAEGQPLNGGIWQLGVFNGALYAGTTNLAGGPELWRSDDPRPGNWTRVIKGGWGNPVPQGFMTIHPFRDHLYLGTVLYPVGTTTYEGCDILRVAADDGVELVVGKSRDPGTGAVVEPLAGMGGGFDYPFNVYSWQSAEYSGWYYLGTYDAGSQAIDYAEVYFGTPVEEWTETEHGLFDSVIGSTDRARQGGADLWRTRDGLQWEPVVLDGFGDRDNYGVRNMLDTPWGFMVATGNAVSGFEIWLGNAAR
jgi:hypothetical protein